MATPDDVIDRFSGSRITDIGNCLLVDGACVVTDFIAAWNALNNPDFVPDAGWTPVLYGTAGRADRAKSVETNVGLYSGPILR